MMSGVLTPFVKLYNKYFFSDKKEPESWDENFNRLYKNYFKGENLPVHELNYFYSLEKQTRKKLKLLDSIDAFIEDDPYIGTKKDVIDPKKNKCRVVKVRHLDERRGIPSTPFIESKKKHKTRKKKRGRKKKNTDGLKHIHVSRIK